MNRLPGRFDRSFLMRCGYRFEELQRMSIAEIVQRVDEERAYEKLVAEAIKNG